MNRLDSKQKAKLRQRRDTPIVEVWIDETERRTWFLFEATLPRN
jgi:hypothetical protein